jgi:tetratricopeptide (TPR) repeat protein
MKEGNQAYNTKQYITAVESYKRVVERDPSYKDAWVNLGLSYLALYQPGSTHEKDIGYSQEAIKAFQEALKLDPESEKLKNYLVETAQKSNNNEVAIQYFEAEHQRHPDDIKTISLIGNLYSKIGDLDKAIEWFQKRLDLEPENPEALYTLGVNCWARSYNHMDLDLEQRFKVLDRGLAALDKAVQIKPDYADAFAYKNLILRQKAAFDPSPEMRLQYTQQADEFLKKTMELRNAQKQQEQQAGQGPTKAGG